ncbi:MAG: hypothetical protein K2J20_02655 [Bacilli bacterium]|nr:hypothetical protein [Bacilli bacterium]
MRSTKINVLGALIITMSLIIIGISGSYAYLVVGVTEVNSENKGVVVKSGALTMDFETTATFNANAIGLINDSDMATQAKSTSFTVNLPSTGKVDAAGYDLYLTDIRMSHNFKSPYLKWALYKGTTEVGSGDFNGVTLSNPTNNVYDASRINLLQDVSISKGDTDSYKLYIWLSNDVNAQQNDLLNGALSVKVGFTAFTK